MAELRFQPEASADLSNLYAFSAARFGIAVADRYLSGLEEACTRLCVYPESAAFHPDLDPQIRCLPYRSHRIFYEYDGKAVTIVRILHQAMNAAGNLN